MTVAGTIGLHRPVAQQDETVSNSQKFPGDGDKHHGAPRLLEDLDGVHFQRGFTQVIQVRIGLV